MKKVAVAIILVVLVAVLLAPGLVSAAGGGGWTWWWVEGPKTSTYSVTLQTEEPFCMEVTGPVSGENWGPGETKSWDLMLTNNASVDLPAALKVWTEGYYAGEDAFYTIDITPPGCGTESTVGLLYGPPVEFRLMPGQTQVLLNITMSETTYVGSRTVHIDLYRGIVHIETVDEGVG